MKEISGESLLCKNEWGVVCNSVADGVAPICLARHIGASHKCKRLADTSRETYRRTTGNYRVGRYVSRDISACDRKLQGGPICLARHIGVAQEITGWADMSRETYRRDSVLARQ